MAEFVQYSVVHHPIAIVEDSISPRVIHQLGLASETKSPAWARFELLVDRLTDGVTVQDASGSVVYANEVGARMSGYSSPAELLRAPTGDYARNFEVMDAAGQPVVLSELPGRKALVAGHAETVLRVRERATGIERWTEVRSFAVSNEAGTPEFVVNVIRDVTASVTALRAEEAARRREEDRRKRAEYLSRATALLGESLSYEVTLERVASLIVPHLADWCAVDLVDGETGDLRRLAVAHVDPDKVGWAWELYRRFPPNKASQQGAYHVLRTGMPELYPSITNEIVAQAARSAEELELLLQLGLKSVMLVPLCIGERTVGVISFVATDSARQYTPEDLEFATELAHRAGHAIERAEFHREAERSIAAATEHAEWLARIQRLTVGLSRCIRLEDVIDMTITFGRDVFEADTAGLWLVGSDRAELHLAGEQGLPVETVARMQTLPLGAPYPIAEAVRLGEPVLIENRGSLFRRYPEIADLIEASGASALACAPVKVAGEIIGALSLRYNAAHDFSDDYVTALRTFGKELGQAIDRTRSHAQLEEARRAADLASDAKSSFLATMSHELRTPINAILGFTDLLDMGIADGQKASASEFVSRIRDNTRHLLDLINDILDWSKVEAGHLSVDATEELSQDVINEALNIVREQALARDLTLRSQCADGARYVGDPLRVRQILLNLLSNAIKFTPAGGQVTLTCAEAASVTTFTVADTGIGIEPRDFETIFEPFVQSKKGYTRQYGGTGLGLSISRRLAQLMNGTLVVDSVPGQGARFTLSLPARERTPPTDPASSGG